ncbi:MAG: phosphoserine phosphatase SerB [Pseudomonadota bacterium]
MTNLLPFSIDLNDAGISLNEYVDKKDSTRLVLVGQSISVNTIICICQKLRIKSVSVEVHPLHLSFGQSVYVLALSEFTVDQRVLTEISDQFFIDVFVQSSISMRDAGVLIMDMDSTVIAMECIDEIAALAGVKQQVAEVTERAMRGEIAFTDSLHRRVACLKGVNITNLASIRSRLPFSPNFMQTMQMLKKHGWTLVLASGGFTYFADYIKDLAQLDYAYSNTLAEDKGVLAGAVVGDVVDATKKADILREVSLKHDIPLEKTIAIGDGANDLKMMKSAGWSVAYRAKPAVKNEANASINTGGFDSLLYMLR